MKPQEFHHREPREVIYHKSSVASVVKFPQRDPPIKEISERQGGWRKPVREVMN